MTSGTASAEPSQQPAQSLPLADIVVLDLTIARAGPTAVRQLADWGADVIRVDAPDDGFEEGRQASPDYLNIHRNKRSLVIDLKHSQGRELLHTLARRADVLVENLRPTVKYRLGFDWDTLRAVNPALVMASISGFGQDGPYATRGGVDQIAQGLGGMMAVTGLPGQGPVRAGVAIGRAVRRGEPMRVARVAAGPRSWEAVAPGGVGQPGGHQPPLISASL